MPSVFYDRLNLTVNLSEGSFQDCSRSISSIGFDSNKLLHLALGLKLAARFHSRLRVLLLGSADEAVALFIETICAAEGIALTLTVNAEADLPVEDGGDRYEAVVLSGPSVNESLHLLATRLASRLVVGGNLFLVSFNDVFRNTSSISRFGMSEQLAELGFISVIEEYFASYLRDDGTLRLGAPDQVIDTAHQGNYVFVVGHARSGTSVLFQLLNDQPEAFMTYEGNFYMHKNRHDLIANYNAVQSLYDRKVSKGFYLPRIAKGRASVTDVFGTLMHHYPLVGDKVAFGPRENIWSDHHAGDAFNWFGRYYPFANYLCCLREPLTSMAAMNRITPNLQPELLLENWSKTSVMALDLLESFPRVRLMLFDNIVAKNFKPVETLLALKCGEGRQRIGADYVTTTQEVKIEYQNGIESSDLDTLAVECSTWFNRLHAIINPETGLPMAETGHLEMDRLRNDLAGLNARIERMVMALRQAS